MDDLGPQARERDRRGGRPYHDAHPLGHLERGCPGERRGRGGLHPGQIVGEGCGLLGVVGRDENPRGPGERQFERHGPTGGARAEHEHLAAGRISVSPHRLDHAAAVGHVAAEALGRPLEQADGPGERRGGARRGDESEGGLTQRPRHDAATKSERRRAADRGGELARIDVAGDQPPVEARRGERPLEQILGGVAGSRRGQHGDHFLQGRAGHAGSILPWTA